MVKFKFLAHLPVDHLAHPVVSALADGLSLEYEWQQVSRTLLSILCNLNNAVVWMVSTRPLIFNSSSPFKKPLEIVLTTLIQICITVTFIFHTFIIGIVVVFVVVVEVVLFFFDLFIYLFIDWFFSYLVWVAFKIVSVQMAL